MASLGQVVSVKYDLFLDSSNGSSHPGDRVGKVDRVEVYLEPDPEDVAISLRDTIHQRRRARDLAHCSAANLRIFPESSPDTELADEDVWRFLRDGAPEKLFVVAPALCLVSPAGGRQSSGQQGVRLSSASQRSMDGVSSQPVSRRDSLASKRDSDAMVVFVKTGGQTIPIEVDANATVDDVKSRVQEQEHIPVEQQRLFLAGNEMASGRLLAHYNVHPGSEIQVVLTLSSSS
ncbi:hypothetical protein CLOP_g10335 [Closterium sp. NIES-67]|nr:hypothetical protein CLOP_g10335 [Closterium sp. NIES-67]